MKVIKRIVCVFLSVMILFFGVSNSYFSPIKMDRVEAAGTVVLGYETMQAICYYFGSLVLGYSSVAEVPDLTEEQIEKVGHAYIKSLFTVNGVPDHVADKLAMANQALFTLISNKQAYVFGSEALKEVAETEFQVIMGGNNGDEEPSPSPDDKKKLNIGKAIGCIGALSVFGATVFEESVKFYADKFSKGEENFIDKEYLAELLKENYFDSSIIDKMVSGENYQLKFSAAMNKAFTCSTHNTQCHITHFADCEVSGFYAAYFTLGGMNASCKLEIRGIIDGQNKKFTGYTGLTSCGDVVKWSGIEYDSMCTNLPLFSSFSELQNFLQTGEGYENALNYLKQYKLADWLQDNWNGELFDPLTGLSYLNDLANMAKHQGLNAIGNDPSLDDMKQHLRDIIANLRPGYDPVTDPSVDPALDPICYPDTIPTPVIDPTADVVLQPAKDPTPSPDPDPSPSTSPKPTTQPTPSPGEIDSSQPVVDLSKFFPFCIPFDLIHLVQALDADPVAPKWTLKLEPPQFPVEWEVTLDLSQFESLAKIFRTGETLLFVVGLILITRGIIKG